MSNKCGKGQIERVGYSYIKKKTNKKISISPTCIKDKGKPGKGLKLIKIPDYDVGLLSKYGYSLAENHENRIKSLKKAIKENSELKILRHLNAIRTLMKSNPKYYNKLDKDMKWIQKDYSNKTGGNNELFDDEDIDEFDIEDVKEWYDIKTPKNNNDFEEIETYKKEHIKKSSKKRTKQEGGKKSSKKSSKKCK